MFDDLIKVIADAFRQRKFVVTARRRKLVERVAICSKVLVLRLRGDVRYNSVSIFFEPEVVEVVFCDNKSPYFNCCYEYDGFDVDVFVRDVLSRL